MRKGSKGGRGASGSGAGSTAVANALGWASIGLGAPLLIAPSAVARLTGVPRNRAGMAIMRAVGARELMAAAGLLMQRERTQWLLARVAGDAMDLALLGRATASPRANRGRLTATTVFIAAV